VWITNRCSQKSSVSKQNILFSQHILTNYTKRCYGSYKTEYKLYLQHNLQRIGRSLRLTCVLDDLHRHEYSKRTEILISWALQHVTFVIRTSTARVKFPQLRRIKIRKICFMNNDENHFSIYGIKRVTWESLYITVNPYVWNLNKFNV
jgi:hypothetical protein